MQDFKEAGWRVESASSLTGSCMQLRSVRLSKATGFIASKIMFASERSETGVPYSLEVVISQQRLFSRGRNGSCLDDNEITGSERVFSQLFRRMI